VPSPMKSPAPALSPGGSDSDAWDNKLAGLGPGRESDSPEGLLTQASEEY
jgi:hypothetical protein